MSAIYNVNYFIRGEEYSLTPAILSNFKGPLLSSAGRPTLLFFFFLTFYFWFIVIRCIPPQPLLKENLSFGSDKRHKISHKRLTKESLSFFKKKATCTLILIIHNRSTF